MKVMEVLDQLEFLFEKYSQEMRATTQPYYLAKLQSRTADFVYDPSDELVRETLIEHIGALPIVATTLYPYINDPTVDLGKALTMVAIHDIGELITGDEMTFTKTDAGRPKEKEAALSLLDHSYHELYEEGEAQQSSTAKFAKAIDKIAPDILDYLMPAQMTIARYKHFVGIDQPDEIVALIRKHKQPFMKWNPFMSQLHATLLDQILSKLRAV